MRLLAAAVLAAALLACGGPHPRVVAAHAGPVRDAVCVVGVELDNGGGDGSAEVTVTLHDRAGNVVGRRSQTFPLRAHEHLTVGMRVTVGTDATEVTADAEAVYPPE